MYVNETVTVRPGVDEHIGFAYIHTYIRTAIHAEKSNNNIRFQEERHFVA
jgi:hypothetical protein